VGQLVVTDGSARRQRRGAGRAVQFDATPVEEGHSGAVFVNRVRHLD
jgi:hypothetical protein